MTRLLASSHKLPGRATGGVAEFPERYHPRQPGLSVSIFGLDCAPNRALAAYKDFLTLWKDADPDIPILKQAKAESSKLQ